MIIGLTGGSGSGKSCAAGYFEKKGFLILDFDQISRDVAMPGSDCVKEIEKVFGSNLTSDSGELNRRALGEIVFADEKKLEILNKITHKYILKKADSIIEENQDRDMIFDAPLLFQAGLDKKCDYVISILADRHLRIRRICQRDAISPETAQNRLSRQPSDEFYLAKSDLCVYNNNGIPQLEKELHQFLRSITDESDSI